MAELSRGGGGGVVGGGGGGGGMPAGMADLFARVEHGSSPTGSDDESENPEEALLPFLKTYGLMNRTATTSEITEDALRVIATRWSVKLKDPKTLKERKREQLVEALIEHIEASSRAVPGSYHLFLDHRREEAERAREQAAKAQKKGYSHVAATMEVSQSMDQLGILKLTKKKKKVQNYFGLPDYAYASSDVALVYKARKNTDNELDSAEIEARRKQEKLAALRAARGEQGFSSMDDDSAQANSSRKADTPGGGDSRPKTPGEKASKNVAAQRKVSEALVTMSRNDTMVKHFMHKGGVDAIIKLIGDTMDKQVLMNCVSALLEVSNKAEYCKVLVDKFIVGSLQQLVERGDLEVRLATIQVMTNLTYQESLRAMLVMGGIVPLVQLVLALTDSHDVVSFTMLIVSNVAAILEHLPDLEVAVKICMQCSKTLEIKENYKNALFAVEIFVNFTRCFQYGSLLCEEGLLPLMMSMLEIYMTPEMISRVSEALVNLSTTRKNRREIANCGIGLFLDSVFMLGAPDNRADILAMIGNLLTSGFFHDKIAREETISTMLNQMLDPKQKRQFVSVSYCLAQMAQVETSATVMIKCNLIPIILNLLPDTPDAALENMWTVLVALSQQPKFFEALVAERALIQEMYKEMASEEGSKLTELIAQIAFNLSLRTDLVEYLSQDLIVMYVEMLKTIFGNNGIKLRATALNTLINFCTYAKTSRVSLLGFDLLTMLEDAGIEDSTMNVRYASLVNILSMEENLSIKLLDGGAQKLLVSMQGSIAAMPSYVAQIDKKKRTRGLPDTSGKPAVPTVIDSDLGKAITAATLHNLSLKRPVMGPGVLMTLMSLLKNCKTSRILHVCRTLANVSTHPRAKLALAKERRLIPLLTSTMRGGCDDADRVQHYCSLVICNVLAVQIDRPIMEELCKVGSITDLVVCTLLRINSVYTKESLAKAMFNLMARADFRFEMASQLGVLSAMIELAKIENVELLELSIRSLYNITCEVSTYAAKIGELKVPNVLVARITSSPNIQGAKPTTAVKFLCAMALANISYEPTLALDLLYDKSLPNAAFCMFQLNSDEATYCTAVLLSNLSKFPEVKNLADTVVIPLLVSIMQRGPASSTQMAVTTLTSYSMLAVFYDQLVAKAMGPMVEIISQPAVHAGIKMEALQFLYNLCTLHEPACVPAIINEVAASLWKVCKGIGSNPEGHEGTLGRIARIVKEICASAAESQTSDALKKLLADGVMSIILKLSKYELPPIKLDLSYAIYSLSQNSVEAIKVLQWDGVDILFWLTLHDCLGLYDPIRKNVARAMRNFSSSGDRGAGAILLAKEERSMTILRCLARSTNEDVQWQAAGVVYNILSVPEAQPDMLSRGVIQLLLDLAAGGYQGVNHVCSACLHLCPSENLPDLSDPAALTLVLCLLEVDGDKFALLGEKSNDMIPYMLPNVNKSSDYVADATPFVASWVCIACEVDSIFSPALVPFPAGNYKELPPPRPSSSQNALSRSHITQNGSEFNYFGVRDKVDIYDPDAEDGAGGLQSATSGASGPATSAGDGGAAGGGPWAFNPVTTEGGPASGTGADGYVPVEPEQASSIAFPKIYTRKEIPSDTLGAIYNSKGSKSAVPRLTEESVSINKHQNKTSRK